MNSRRFVGGLIRFGLVILACWLVIAWGRRKFSSHNHVRVEAQAPPETWARATCASTTPTAPSTSC